MILTLTTAWSGPYTVTEAEVLQTAGGAVMIAFGASPPGMAGANVYDGRLPLQPGQVFWARATDASVTAWLHRITAAGVVLPPVPSGTIVIGAFGQSNIQYPIGARSPWDNIPGGQRPTITVQNMKFITDTNNSNPSGTRFDFEVIDVTTETVNVTRKVPASLGALSVFLNYVMPGVQFAVLDLAVTGTSRTSIRTDGDSATRSWAEFAAIIEFCRAQVGDIRLIIDYWYAADASTLATFLASWIRFYLGQAADGSPAPLGVGGLDHILWDIEAAPGDRGRGIFTRAGTKLAISQPKNEFDWLDLRGINDFAADPRVQTILQEVGPAPQLAAWAGGHALADDPDGHIYSIWNWAPAMLKAAGFDIKYPQVLRIEPAPDGSYADVVVSLPNGGNLTTIRALEGRGAPVSPNEFYQPVMGFEIARAGDADPDATSSGGSPVPTDRKPMVPLSSTGYATKYRGTVVIQDAGSGVGAARTGRIRFTPLVPFVSGDKISYLQDYRGLGGYTTANVQLETVDKIWLNFPIEAVPAWRDPAALYKFPGLGLMRPTTKLAIDITPPPASGLTAPVVLANTEVRGSGILLRESATFTAPSGSTCFAILLTISSMSSGSTDDPVVSLTAGSPGRAAGSGVAAVLQQVSASNRRNRWSTQARTFVGTGAPQTVQVEYAANAPSNQRIVVLQLPNATLPPVAVGEHLQSSANYIEQAMTGNLNSRYNGVLLLSVKAGSTTPHSMSPALMPVWEGPIGEEAVAATNGRGGIWFAIPDAAGAYSYTIGFGASTASRIQQAIQLAPVP